MSAERLAIGDLVRCSKCRGWHPAEQSASGSSTDYAERMLFMCCGAGLFYVGQQGLPARDPKQVRCGRCGGERWICEEHSDLPWPHDDCAGPGEPCPICNTTEPPDLPEGFRTIA